MGKAKLENVPQTQPVEVSSKRAHQALALGAEEHWLGIVELEIMLPAGKKGAEAGAGELPQPRRRRLW